MKAYNEQWICNRSIREQAGRWHRQQLITPDQLKQIEKRYPVNFRETNGFMEVGLFLFTTVAVIACYLLPASMFSLLSENPLAYGLFNMASGIIIGLIGNLLIARRLLYRNGIDNAFVVTMAGFLAFGLNQLLPTTLSTAAHCFLSLPLLLLILWYYGDTLIAFFVFATLYTAVFDGLLSFSWGKAAMPFVMMLLSGVVYVAVTQFQKNNPKQVYYADPLNLVEWAALIMLAASGNYFVVRHLNNLLLAGGLVNSTEGKAPEIALPALFWILTFLIPIAYAWQGWIKKNRMLLALGMAGLMAAVATLYAYTDLVRLNVALTVGGAVLIGIAVVGIQFLSKPTHGFTDEPDDDSPDEFFTNAATMAATQAAGITAQEPKDNLRFGDGKFGGGGSEGAY